jgi:hypothetical protein
LKLRAETERFRRVSTKPIESTMSGLVGALDVLQVECSTLGRRIARRRD